jgi:FAD/FMN-containing dehydrogenase
MNPKAATELKRLLGNGDVRSGPAALSPYFREKVDADLVVVTPKDVNKLSDVAYFASENDIPLFSLKRRWSDPAAFKGKDGILVDLAKMNKIKKIDTGNLVAHVYGGVTFEQLSAELAKENQRVLYPVTGASPYILRSYIDRELLMGSGGYRHINMSIFHAMMASGEKWVSGSQQLTDEGHADFREDQGPQFSPFFGASEDIFGIPYYGLVYTYPNREEHRLVAFGFDELAAAKDLLYKVSRAEWCFEAFCANDRFLSVKLADGDAGKVAALKKKLNPWTVVVSMEHYKELVDLWERYIKDAAKELGGKSLKGAVPEQIEASLSGPWYAYDRDFYKGRCDHVFGYQYFKNVPDTFAAIDEQAASAGVKPEELGKLVVPVYFGGAGYCEADIHYDPKDEKAAAAANTAYLKSFEALLDMKTFVDKPVGPVAEMVYSRTHPSYVDMIKLLKKQLDPKGILNPDQLLEGV